jgi:bifunctional DNA-binding transcriptional regulator/antitoxin component of YhaV-PrlF toxin-antitoxin module
VRRRLGVDAGDYVQFEAAENGTFLMRAAARAAELSGLISYKGTSRSVEEIRAASRATFRK